MTTDTKELVKRLLSNAGSWAEIEGAYAIERLSEEVERLKDAQWNADDELSKALGNSVRFMDPPDGGSVTMPEQVARMRQALEAAEAEVERLEKSETQLIEERDAAEECISDIYFMMTGKSPEWTGSSKTYGGFGFAEALEELTDVREVLAGGIRMAQAEVERLKGALNVLVSALDATHWSSWQTTYIFQKPLDDARSALRGEE